MRSRTILPWMETPKTRCPRAVDVGSPELQRNRIFASGHIELIPVKTFASRLVGETPSSCRQQEKPIEPIFHRAAPLPPFYFRQSPVTCGIGLIPSRASQSGDVGR